MEKSRFIRQTAALALVALLPQTAAGRTYPRFPVVDLHVDLPYQVNYKSQPFESGIGQLVASRLLDAGMVGVVLPLFVPHDVAPGGPRLIDLEMSYARIYPKLDSTAPYLVPTCASVPERVHTWLAIENAAPFAGHPEEVARWVNSGVKVWGLVHAQNNALASSSGFGRKAPRATFGLTAAGRQLVQAIHAAGGIVDVSHASDPAFDDVLQLARNARMPVVASHSNCRVLAPHPRNLTDSQIVAIAELGGIIGVNFHGPYLRIGRKATMDDVVAHVEHIAKLVGFSHVAIGSDFEGGISPPEGLETANDYSNLAQALLARGHSEQQLRQLFADNALRLLGCPPKPQAEALPHPADGR